jgi:hypothetical protein
MARHGVGMEQRAVHWLQYCGHRGIQPLRQHVFKDDSGVEVAQICAGATADGCAVLVEKQQRLTTSNMKDAKKTFDIIK